MQFVTTNAPKSEVNFQELLVNLLGNLSEREQEVLRKRYYLTNDLEKRATLKQIGDYYNITRERVRQIEKEAIRKLVGLGKEYADTLRIIEDKFVSYLEQNGGLAREDYLLDEHALKNHNFDYFHTNSFLFVFDKLIESVDKEYENEALYPVWHLKDFELDKVVDYLDDVKKQIEVNKTLHTQEEIIELAERMMPVDLKAAVDNFLSKHSEVELRQVLESYLAVSTGIEKNILGQWGLSHWENVGPKKLGDKIHLIFQKDNQPLHFRDIANLINDAKFDHKKICAATVHNELIANENYVLVGRGIYALKDWGFQSGTVADIITSILKEANRPMTKDEVYEEVLKQRQVNKSTIYLTLINKDKFDKIGSNLFNIRS
ncbi:MAG: RNA polymerase sigma factor [Parcubacteria group bacterium GW2011_GWC2_39_14]|nr:MAG: RNA polymerase sigma factor [Parcubacteria group bacterium GW2011_GWC2_39_14]KKR54876.1 MAG: RNA polymerase sigma factor [Parcubacteria group bacterium GW2011_GWA2_40_23]